MNRSDYLKLMIGTYFETFDECFEDIDFLEYSFEDRKNRFVKQIEREQKKNEQASEISLNDFIDEFNFALFFLDSQIITNIHEHIKKAQESEINDITSGEVTVYVPLQKVNSTLIGCLCVKDVEYIKLCFNSFVVRSHRAAKADEEKEFKFINNFDQNSHKIVYEYFLKELVNKGYLSKENLEKYLISAFQNRETPPITKIKFLNKHTGNIISVFYKYYKDGIETHGKQEKYAELLGEYFDGFTTKRTMNNFSKNN